ncbi:MAG: GLPGLI family protein [Tannerella sp.]|jgi:GLPGLI family protein|nr:GLPGLI family protein [Tannerella sp.]
MKRIFLSLLLVFIFLQYLSAQALKVEYKEEVNPYANRDVSKDYEHISSPEVRAALEKHAKSLMVRNLELIVKGGISTYSEVKKPNPEEKETSSIETSDTKATLTVSRQNVAPLVIYRNNIDSIYINQMELDGKTYLVESSKVPEFGWEITSEQKNILGYNCIKATATVGRARKIGDIETQPQNVAAWYSPDIPVNAGPANYSGLPGLILEVNVGDGKHVLTGVSLEPVSSVAEIPKPEQGEKVNGDEFAKIVSQSIASKLEHGKQQAASSGDGVTHKIRISSF